MKGRLVKGSIAAKRHMAYLRSLRRTNGRQLRRRRHVRGGVALGPEILRELATSSIGNWVDWGKAYKQERDSQLSEIQHLESLERARQRNPKMSKNDLLNNYQQWKSAQSPDVEQVGLNNGTFGNVLRGPTGWIRLIGRTSRDNKIKALKKKLGF